jgi:predicted membrane chloride channel (bestrophin family)
LTRISLPSLPDLMASATQPAKRSFTGNHPLKPAHRYIGEFFVPIVPNHTFISWTFGRGTVIWRLWPAVLLHTAFAAAVVSVSINTKFRLNIPPVLLTVLGVVIGFVISYRASSGYDRYWMGRTYWSDVIRNARGMGRVIWFHVPPRVSPRTPEEIAEGKTQRSKEEMFKVMAEKRMALDLIEGFVVALKHHLRGELGIYYEDLYHLVRPLHAHFKNEDKLYHLGHDDHVNQSPTQQVTSPTSLHPPPLPRLPGRRASRSPARSSSPYIPIVTADPVIPAVNAYGTFDATAPRPVSRQSMISCSSNSSGPTRPLLPSEMHTTSTGIMSGVSRDLIPFESIFHFIHRILWRSSKLILPIEDPSGNGVPKEINRKSHEKHRPKVAGGGQNLPLAILRCLSEWVSVLDDRTTMNGNANAGLYTYISNFEDNLTALERVLTTPLPFVYSVHIRHTVWIYLFFLPFQLIDQFGWSTIAGVGIASFIYLGFLAAGEEIEQPFGYDENDLDLDSFCQDIIHKDIDQLKGSPCLNSYFTHRASSGVHRSIVEISSKSLNDQQEQEVFGILL